MLIFICLVSRTSTQFYFIFHVVLKVFWISVSVEYTLLEKSEQMSKSGFFLSRLHIGLDSGFSSKIGRIPQNWDDWTVCTWGLRLWAARGVWGHATIEMLQKSWRSEMLFLVFREVSFHLKCLLNWLQFLIFIIVCVALHASTPLYVKFCAV